MANNYPDKLIKDTLKQIQEQRLRNQGRKKVALEQETVNSIRSLREHLSPKQIMKELSLSRYQVYTALRLGAKKKSAPSRFVEVHQITPTNPIQKNRGRIVLELKTESGMTISIYG
jgi:DNA-binding CsgD family transcriptional regulator